MPAVSIILPTYNRSNLLREAIESAQRQTFTDFEILVIDDGSTDDTRSVIERISDTRIKYFYKSNGGVSSARNVGLVNAVGEYVAFLDSDDLWPEEHLETMLDKLEKTPDYGMAYSQFKDVYPDGREAQGFSRVRCLSGYLTKSFFDISPCILPSATFFRKFVLKGIFFDEALETSSDFDVFLRLSPKTQFLCVPEVCFIRRKTADSLIDKAIESISPNVALILERFYFHLGGDKIIPAKVAKRRISREYQNLARRHYNRGNRHAAISLYKKAISYYPFKVKNYKKLFHAILSRKEDPMPQWQMPKPLPPYITVTKKNFVINMKRTCIKNGVKQLNYVQENNG